MARNIEMFRFSLNVRRIRSKMRKRRHLLSNIINLEEKSGTYVPDFSTFRPSRCNFMPN